MNKKLIRQLPKGEIDRIELLEAQLRKVKAETREARRTAPRVETAETLQRALRLDGVRDRMIAQPMDVRLRAYQRPKAIRELAFRLFSKWPAPEFLFKGLIAPELALEILGDPIPGQAPLNEKDANLMRDLWIDFSTGASPAPRLHNILPKREIPFLWEVPSRTTWPRALTFVRARGLGMDRFQAGCLAMNFQEEPIRSQALRFFDLNRAWWADRFSEAIDYVWQHSHPTWEPAVTPRRQRRQGNTQSQVVAQGRKWSGFLQRPWSRPAGRFEWRAIELLTDVDLKEEGEIQRHCVGTYATDCLRYGSRIISLRWVVPESLTPDGFEIERVTLEITKEGRIVQAKGPDNESPSWQALKQVNALARDLGLAVGDDL